MPKYEALPLILAALRLQESFPIIGISDTASVQYHNDFENLALIEKNPVGKYSLTAFGDEVLAQRRDLRGSILATICTRFDLPWHGWIAAAYVDAQRECFLINKYSSTCGLYLSNLPWPIILATIPIVPKLILWSRLAPQMTHGIARSCIRRCGST